jgi:VWFA-related protein
MNLHPLASVLLLAAWTPAFAAHAADTPAPKPPTFSESLDVDLINIDVYATDRNGRRVTGLKKEDFEVLDDGRRVEITNFSAPEAGAGAVSSKGGKHAAKEAPKADPAPEEPWNLVVFVDDLNIAPAHRARALRQLGEFLDREVAPGDRVMIATYDMGLHIRVPFTSDRATLDQGLREISSLAARGADASSDRRQAVDAIMSIQKDALSDPNDRVPCPQNIVTPAHSYASTRRQEVLQSVNALTVLVNSLSGVPGRKAVLHVSDGIPLTPGEEVFQFLAEICGGHGTSGFGKSANTSNEALQRSNVTAGRGGLDGGPLSGREQENDDAAAVYDIAMLKPQSYKGVSQAPMDAQAYSVAKNLQALAAHANAHRVTLYTLQASGLQGTDASDAGFGPGERLLQFPSVGKLMRSSLRDSLQLLADGTGGRSILDANDARSELASMREDFSSYYSLGFTPAHAGDGHEHKLTVRAKRSDLRLRYRQSYRDKPVLERSVDRTLAALFYGIEENPLDVGVEIGEQNAVENGEYAVPVRLRIPLFKLAILNLGDGSFEGKLRLLFAVRDEQGGTSAVRQVEVPVKIPRKDVLNALGQYYVYTLTLNLKPGPQRVAVAVRDDVAASTSYLSRPVVVGTPGAAAMANP